MLAVRLCPLSRRHAFPFNLIPKRSKRPPPTGPGAEAFSYHSIALHCCTASIPERIPSLAEMCVSGIFVIPCEIPYSHLSPPLSPFGCYPRFSHAAFGGAASRCRRFFAGRQTEGFD